MTTQSPKLIAAAIGTYVVAINAIAAWLFWFDKQQAVKHQWRVSERRLHSTALAGGWIGGIWAMKKFRHKTIKKSFKDTYYACAATNAAIVGTLSTAFALRGRNAARLLANFRRI
jgi:uncharacterized membrane protein YsdA (DUF1294 family)